jgi:hypothetical protein
MKMQIRAITLLASLVLALMVPLSAMADQTITGEVSDAQEIIASDGSVYTILDNEKGEELASMVGDTVAVTGTVEEVDGTKSITVESFIVIENSAIRALKTGAGPGLACSGSDRRVSRRNANFRFCFTQQSEPLVL